MKKLLAALLLTATTAGVASANMTGFYVGVGAVTGSTTARYNDATVNGATAAAPDQSVFTTFKTDAGKTMFGGRLTAGYGMTFAGCGWFGVEAYATVLNTKFDTLNGRATAVGTQAAPSGKLTNKYNYGIEAKIGYHFTKDTVGFIGVAAEAGKYKLEWRTENLNAAGSYLTYSASKTKVYVKPVIGVRTTGIGGNRNLFLEMKYGYGFANRLTLRVPTAAGGAFNGANSLTGGRNVSVRPRTHELSLTIGWKF